MAQSLSFAPICSLKSSNTPGAVIGNSVVRKAFPMKEVCLNSKAGNFQSLVVKATEDSSKGTTKVKSIVCADCTGNGAKECTQCQGSGVNLIDHFNGRFKAGGLCWLCRGKKDILCGSCNGAGFIGGFMSTFDD
ncbi:putative Heat shock protein DnaJ, cysteine-rich [Medicago truncatula]|uniref:Chaperon protein P13.9, putative n=1 Tax=Medicago truncatula TaxID=3880 RepID=G7JCY8_MEDTR|nr:protein BUNDLE SHEATH DEFECTIVE 2, chloroplastic [Medicago truncatula]AES91497.1 chaperon protein P13.9, putative [Medicago truncatula]AFK48345.1 unknown [Medicago truncatula]RHN63935.1 putative Heat shock protein DnaJ, cysteine-rich [Medicago truncatula]